MSMMPNTLSVREYKQIFDDNNYKNNSYEMALFIKFLVKKKNSVKEMEKLTGLKKSQIHCYKKILKKNKTEELRTTPFRKVLKSCIKPKPEEEELVYELEELSITDQGTNTLSRWERPHFFKEYDESSGGETYT